MHADDLPAADRSPSDPIYQVESTEPPSPPLPGQVVVRPDAEDVHSALGSDLLVHARNCVRSFGDFHLALSGGSTPIPFYRRLMVDPGFREFPWERTHLWIVDERRVGFDDERSNYAAIAGHIAEHTDIPERNVHPIRATDDDADTAYEAELRETLAWREKGHDRLDFALLGMGGDGHTASLFPRSRALDAPGDRLIVINDGPEVTPPDRVTMTYTLLNATRFLAVLVTGAGKRDMLGRIASGDGTRDELPILGIEPVGGTLRWYLDHDACPVDED